MALLVRLILLCLVCVCLCESATNTGYQFFRRESTYAAPRTQPRGSSRMTRSQYMCIVLGVCSSALPRSTVAQSHKIPRIVHQWNQLEFDYPSEAERSADIAAGLFTPATIGPIDVDVYYSRRAPNLNHIFISIPRFVAGVPVTFGVVTNKNYTGNPLIRPYPDWSWHKNPEQCKRDRIVSVFRVRIDECGRLWVLDTGKIGKNMICRPQILAFNLETNQVIHRHEFSTEVVGAQSLVVTPVVDVRDPNAGCQDTFVYIADVLGFSLIVHDVFQDRSWKIQDKSMYPYPNFGTYNIAGDSFELMDGILGLSLSPNRPGEDRVLFFHAMSSPTENWVYTSDIRNYTRFQSNSASSPEIFHTYREGRTTQSAAEDINKDGIMFFGLLSDITIACWNTMMDYGTNQFDIVANNPVTMQFPSGIKVIKNSRGEEELWILTSRFQKIANGSLNTNEPNFRIQAVMIDELLQGSSCRGKKHFSQNQIVGASSGYGLYGKRG